MLNITSKNIYFLIGVIVALSTVLYVIVIILIAILMRKYMNETKELSEETKEPVFGSKDVAVKRLLVSRDNSDKKLSDVGTVQAKYFADPLAFDETGIDTPHEVEVIIEKALFTQQYEDISFFYQAAIQQLTTKLEILNKDFKRNNDRSPIESITSRIKTMESISQKLEHKGLDLTLDNLLENIRDMAGIRVVCPFINDIYYIKSMLEQQSDVTIIKVKDYIKEPKDSGYRSLHLIVKTPVYFADGPKDITVEIQIRTIAMNMWASTDHSIRYKRGSQITPEVHQKMLECSELMAKTDEQMQQLAEQVNF